MEAVLIVWIIIYALIALAGLALSIFIWVNIIKLIKKIIKKYFD